MTVSLTNDPMGPISNVTFALTSPGDPTFHSDWNLVPRRTAFWLPVKP